MRNRISRERGFRQILKIAFRSSLRNLRQTILIVLIIAAPLAVGSTILTVEESRELTPRERVELELGGAQARFSAQRPVSLEQARDTSIQSLFQMPDAETIFGGTPEPSPTDQSTLQDPRALGLIEGFWVTALESSVTVETKYGLGSMLLVEGEVWLLDSRYDLVAGRFPENDNEVLLSPGAQTRIGTELGDEVLISGGVPKRVVGVLNSLTSVDSASLAFALSAAVTGVMPEDNLAETNFYLLGSEAVTWDRVLEFNRFGIGVLSAEVLMSPPVEEEISAELQTLLLSGNQDLIFDAVLVFSLFFVLAVPIAILSGAAFAFGARRQEKTLALMSSLGASPKQLRQVTTLSAVLLGITGGLIGIGVGLAVAAVILPIQAQGSRLLYPGFHLPLFDLILLLGLSTITAYLVSLIPARNAAKVDVVATLRGRRLGLAVSRKTKAGSLVLILLGLGLMAFRYLESNTTLVSMSATGDTGLVAWLAIQSFFLGATLLLIGLLIGSAWLLELLRIITLRGGIAARYAAKDILFNRKRYQAVIAAVLAASFLGSSILVFTFGALRSDEQSYRAKLVENQILVDPKPSMPELINPIGILGQEREFFEDAAARANSRLEQKLNVLLGATEVENYALVDQFVPLSSLGYGTDPETFITELGAEGLQPLLRLPAEYLCPWNRGHPDHEEYLAIQDSGNWEAALEFARDPEFDDCGRSNSIRDQFFVGDVADLEVVLGKRPPSSAVAALESGGAVVFKEEFLIDGRVILDWYPSSSLGYLSESSIDYFDQESSQAPLPELSYSVSLDASLVETPYRNATIMISPKTAADLEIRPVFQLLIANFSDELSIQQRDFLNAELDGYLIEEGFWPNPDDTGWLIILIAAAFILAASSIALSLVQIESRPDLSTLAAVGAPRLFRAKVVALQALFLTGLGVLAGAIVGVLLGMNVLDILLITEIELPWPQLAFLLMVAPLLISLLTFLATPKKVTFNSRNALD